MQDMMDDFNFSHPQWSPTNTASPEPEDIPFLVDDPIVPAYPSWEVYREHQDAIDKEFFQSLASPDSESGDSEPWVIKALRREFGDKLSHSLIVNTAYQVEHELLYRHIGYNSEDWLVHARAELSKYVLESMANDWSSSDDELNHEDMTPLGL